MRDTKTGRSASFRIVTLEREYGCGAAGIAEKLATRLGWTLWDQRLTQEIARLAHSEKSAVEKREERRDPLYYRLFKSFALGSYEGSPGVPVETLDADSIVRISEGVVEEAAAAGNCVIVGRGSQHFLRARSLPVRCGRFPSLVAQAGIDRLALAIAAADPIDREIGGGLEQEGAEKADGAGILQAEEAHVGFLRDLFRFLHGM